MASTSGRIINASVGPKLKKQVQDIVLQKPEKYRTVSDFVTQALLELIAKNESNIETTYGTNHQIAEPKVEYESSPANRTHILEKLAYNSEKLADNEEKLGNYTEALDYRKEASNYYKELLGEMGSKEKEKSD
ncbi:hypothetical protein V7O66_03310 [Methanolobus sp. ZRKC3]|uniref:hypothetical protein n=1 Tax=Methanolobus sp. ZRKC3 TaxID=3125786 RepID=UPI00324DDA18